MTDTATSNFGLYDHRHKVNISKEMNVRHRFTLREFELCYEYETGRQELIAEETEPWRG